MDVASRTFPALDSKGHLIGVNLSLLAAECDILP